MIGFLIELIIAVWLGTVILGMFGINTEDIADAVSQTIEQPTKQEIREKNEFIRKEL